MRPIFLISDTHFHHENMLKFKDDDGAYQRPGFSCVEEMDEYIVERWNEVVTPQDHVYHLGDVWHKPSKILTRLNGKKRLILGNHDNPKNPEIFNAFQKISLWRMFPDLECVLTHVPIIIPEMAKFKINVHGHIHSKPSPTDQHINVSVEAINYTPVILQDILRERSHYYDCENRDRNQRETSGNPRSFRQG